MPDTQFCKHTPKMLVLPLKSTVDYILNYINTSNLNFSWFLSNKCQCFVVGKLKMNSEIQNFKILTPFVTSRTPKMTQNGPKIT